VKAPDFDTPIMDAEWYDYWARGIAFGEWTPPVGQPDPQVTSTPFAWPPGYPYFLGAVYALTDGDHLEVLLIQMGLGLGNAVLLYFLARAIFGPAVGLISAGLAAVYWAFVYFEGELNSPTLVIFLVLCLVHSLRFWMRKPFWVNALAPGVILGVLTTIRPELGLILPLAMAWGGWVARGRVPWRRLGALGVVLLVGMTAAIAPVTIRNLLVSGEFVPICVGGGPNLRGGNNPAADGMRPSMDMREFTGVSKPATNYIIPLVRRSVMKRLNRTDLTYRETSNYFTRKALEYMAENPGRTCYLMAKKALLFWGPAEITNNKVLYYEKEHSAVLRFLPGFPVLLGLALFGIGLMGIHARGVRRERTWKLERNGFRLVVLVVLVMMAVFSSVLPFHMAARYRLPVLPFLMIFASYGIRHIALSLRGESLGRATAQGAAVIALIAACHIPLVHYEYDLGKWHHDRAQAYRGKGDDAASIEEFRRAAEARPGNVYYLTLYGQELCRQGFLEEAIVWLESAVDNDSSYAPAHDSLGEALYLGGHTDEALEHFEEARKLEPLLVSARINVGKVLIDRNQYDAAIAEFREAADIDPTDLRVQYNWSRALALAGQSREAFDLLLVVAQSRPDDADVLNKLGLLLEDMGKPEEARRYFERAAAISPPLPRAFFNLAASLAVAGRFDDALERFRQGVEAASENDDVPASLGAMLENTKRTETAIDLYAYLLERNPSDTETQTSLGNALVRGGRFAEAADQYEGILELDPENRNAYFNLGVIYGGNLDFETAAYCFREVLARAPEDEEATNMLGIVLLKLGRVDEATVSYREALKYHPESNGLRAAVRKLLEVQGILGEEADAYIADMHTGHGQAFEAEGHRDEAIRQYEAALGVMPANGAAREALDRLVAEGKADAVE